MTTANKSEKDRVIVFDTTLRDGEQCPGATMNLQFRHFAARLIEASRAAFQRGSPLTSSIACPGG